MKWAYSISNKITASILLFVVLGVVVVNNIIERKNAREIQQVVTTIYNDRLVVEGYIYSYAERLHEFSEFAVAQRYTNRHSISGLTGAIAEVHELHEKYLKTKLTDQETKTFHEFMQICDQIEANLMKEDFEEVQTLSKTGLSRLKVLSVIQLTQGKIEIEKAAKKYSSNYVLFTFEVAIIFIILIIIQGLIFASKSLKSTVQSTGNKASMN